MPFGVGCCFQQALPGFIGDLQIESVVLLTEPRKIQSKLAARDFSTLLPLQRKDELALDGLIVVVDHHHHKAPIRTGLQRGLPEINIDPERFEGFTHVVPKMRFQVKSLNVPEVVGSVSSWIAGSKINEVQDAGVVAIGAPELSQPRQQIRVERKSFFRCCVRSQEF